MSCSHSWVDTSNPDFIKENIVVIPAGADRKEGYERRSTQNPESAWRWVSGHICVWQGILNEFTKVGRRAHSGWRHSLDCPLWVAPFPGLPTLGGAIPCTIPWTAHSGWCHSLDCPLLEVPFPAPHN